MELEFHELVLRYERLRVMRPARERRLLGSLATIGQQVPIFVVGDAEPGRYVVIDGYKRVRLLRRLGKDAVRATCWEMEESEALVVSRLVGTGEGETALEQAWLLDELQRRFGVRQEELARRFDRSVSWVSRRLGLVREVPDGVQERVRRGEIGAHAAVKYLLPLARANAAGCEALAGVIASAKLASREVGLLYAAWRDGTGRTRERLIEEPLVLLRALKEAEGGRRGERERSPGQRLLDDFELLGGIARRAHRQLRAGAAGRLLPGEREELVGCFAQSRVEMDRLGRRVEKELGDAGSRGACGDPGASRQGDGEPCDCEGDGAVARGGAEGDPGGGVGGAGDPQGGEGGAAPGGDPRALRAV
jgi:ParB/RepB/Spo0J family partition protein